MQLNHLFPFTGIGGLANQFEIIEEAMNCG